MLPKVWTPWVWLVVLAGIVSLHFWFPPVAAQPATDTHSTTGEGKKAFFRLVEAETGRAERSFDSLRNLLARAERYGATDTICLLGPLRRPTDSERDELLRWVSDGGNLLWAVPENVFSHQLWADVGLDEQEEELELLPGARLVVADETDGNPIESSLLAAGETLWRSGATLEMDDAEVLVSRDGAAQAVWFGYGDGLVVLTASDFIFSNQSLAWRDNSVLAYRLLEAVDFGGTLYFDESLNATGTPKVVGLLFDPPFRAVTVQLLLLVVVFGWSGSRRFGPLLPEPNPVRGNIVEHTDAVGNLRYRAGDGAGALRGYVRQFMTELRLRTREGRETRTLEPVAKRLGLSLVELRQILRHADRKEDAGDVDRRYAADLIRRLAEVRRSSRTRRDS